MAGQLEITEAMSWRSSTTSATDLGRQGDSASFRPTRMTAEGSPAEAREAYFSLFHETDRGGGGGGYKRLLDCVQYDANSPSNGGN